MNQTTLWRLPQLTGLEFLHAAYTDFTYAPHFHEDYAIGVVEKGIHAFYYRGEHHNIPADHIVTCQPGEVHTGHAGSDSPWHYRMLYIHPSLLQQVASESGHLGQSLPFLNHTFVAHPQAVQAVRILHQQSERGAPTLFQEVQLREFLALMLTYFSEIRLSAPAITNEKIPMMGVKSYIQEHYADDIQLEDLARAAHLSKSYLIRAFRHHEGLSPYAYLVQVRLNRAKTLLEKGQSAKDVAQETGFFDQSHLTHAFKRFLGITPARYQQSRG